jgi:hypothetical protein
MKHLVFCLLLVIGLGSGAFAVDAPAVLPKDFGGWHMQGPAKTSTDAAFADPANASLLKEYGFNDFASAVYTREDGRKLTLKAARFNDASGAFGAYTFYYQPEMQREEIGDQGASFNQRILFYRGNILLDAVFDRVTAMSAAELRELAGSLPKPAGNSGNLPPVLAYMPHQGYVKNTEKYIEGPIALSHVASPVPADLINFGAGAEVVLGQYTNKNGDATVMIISYPTPQIAADQMRKIDATHVPTQQQPGVATIVDAGPFFDKRSGPLLAIAAGQITSSDARDLLSKINYDADVTWNQNTFFDKKNNLANLLVNIIILCGILMGLALIAGFAFGGIRIAMGRLFPGRVFDRPENVEFIALHLQEDKQEPGNSHLSSSIKAG